jgi:hypothetical protein
LQLEIGFGEGALANELAHWVRADKSYRFDLRANALVFGAEIDERFSRNTAWSR